MATQHRGRRDMTGARCSPAAWLRPGRLADTAPSAKANRRRRCTAALPLLISRSSPKAGWHRVFRGSRRRASCQGSCHYFDALRKVFNNLLRTQHTGAAVVSRLPGCCIRRLKKRDTARPDRQSEPAPRVMPRSGMSASLKLPYKAFGTLSARPECVFGVVCKHCSGRVQVRCQPPNGLRAAVRSYRKRSMIHSASR